MLHKLAAILFFAFLQVTALSAHLMYGQNRPNVVISIKPIHSLISFLMQEVKEPQVIVDGFLSEHEYYLKPSDIRILKQAQLVIWVGNTIDPFMNSYIKNAPSTQMIIKIQDIPGLHILSLRQGGVWEQHTHCHENELQEEINSRDGDLKENLNRECIEEDKDKIDGHLWLDPQNAKIIAAYISSQLIILDPQNQAIYLKNLSQLNLRLDEIDRQVAKNLTSHHQNPILVAHDAYQYFEKRYQLNVVGSVTLTPGESLSIKRLHDILGKISAYPQLCIFQEPQFNNQKLAEILNSSHTKVKIGTLDPIGANIPAGPNLYFELLTNLVNQILKCAEP